MPKAKVSLFKRSIFIDSSNLDEILKWNATGIIDGVTTNQFIMLKEGVKPKQYTKVIRAICREMKNKPVSVELTDSKTSPDKMIEEARKLNKIAANIVVKVPIVPNTAKSLLVINELGKLDIAVNATIMMTFEQMVMAILAIRNSYKQSFISLFWGRSIEDQANYRDRSDFMAKFPRVGLASQVNNHPKNIIAATLAFLREAELSNPKIIVGSLRSATSAGEAFAAGAHICTLAPDILTAMLFSQRTIETNEQFDQAWRQLQKKS